MPPGTTDGDPPVAHDSDTVRVTVVQPPAMPTIDSFTVSPTHIVQGGVAILSWSTRNATSLDIPEIGMSDAPASGRAPVSPSQPGGYGYTLIAKNAAGSTDYGVVLYVDAPATACVTTPSGQLSFAYQRESGGTYTYAVDAGAGPPAPLIVGVKNANQVPIDIAGAGAKTQLAPGETTDVFDELFLDGNWVVTTFQYVQTVQVEFCTAS